MLLFILFGWAVIATSCDDYLEESPDNRVELNTLDQAAQLLTNAYPEGSYYFTEWMGDQVGYTRGTRKDQEWLRIYGWEVVNADPEKQDTPEFYWANTYGAIAHANEVLAVVDQLASENIRRDDLPDDEAQRQAIRGEALLARAYGHFMLVNLFAKHYDPQTASSDLGVPYVTTPETEFIQEYRRATVQQVYDRIETDLLEGLALVDGSFYANSGKYHFTRESALAFASRFYLYQYDYENCIRYSSELLEPNPSIYIKDLADLKRQQTNSDDYIRLWTSPNDDSNLLLLRQETLIMNSVGFYPLRPDYSSLFNTNPFGETDLRADPAFVFGEDGLLATKFEALFQRTSLTSNVGFPYTIFMGFRGAEVLLNRAESYAQSNRLDEAIQDIQTLTEKRYEGDVTIDLETIRRFYGSPVGVSDRVLVLDYTINVERVKEFLHEGLRWFDIKRFGFEVEHTFPDGTTATLSADDNRRVLQIPEAAQEIGGLRANPR